MFRRTLTALLALVLVISACSGPDSGEGEGLTLGTAVVAVNGSVEGNGRLIQVIPTEILLHVPSRYSVGLGERIAIPEPIVGEALEVRTMDGVDIPEGEPLTLFLSYVPVASDGWHWKLHLAVDQETQEPTAGLSQAARDQLDRLLAEEESPEEDLVPAIIEMIIELTEYRDARDAGEPVGLSVGPRYDAFSGKTESAEITDPLDEFLATPAEARQIPDMLADFPQGADAALGVDWQWREIALQFDREGTPYTAFGLVVDGVGVAGPIAFDAQDPIIPIDSYLVKGQGFRLVGWLDELEGIASSADAVEIGVIDDSDLIAMWDADDAGALLIDLRNGFDTTYMSGAALSRYVGQALEDAGLVTEPRSEEDG